MPLSRTIRIIAVMSALITMTASPVCAKNLGVVGTVYPIAEADALMLIEERASQIDWSKAIDKEAAQNKIKKFKPQGVNKLPRAPQSRKFTVDMTYTLDFDIPDGKGGVLYPKGFTFNPLDYVSYPKTIVVIDASDKAQVAWFKKSEWAKDINSILLITDGSYYDTATELRRPVFYAVQGIAQRLKLEYVPSVVRQIGNRMEVIEVDVASSKTSQ